MTLIKNILIVICIVSCLKIKAQPILVNSTPYGNVNNITFDSTLRRVYYQITNGCASWNIPCAYAYTLSSMYNILTKHDFSDNTVSQTLANREMIICPGYPVNNYNSAVAHQSVFENNFIYTNFGYYFSKIDTNLMVPNNIWTYAPPTNSSFKEITTFEMKSDSVFLFQKDSTSGINYYSLLLKNKYTGNDIPYTSLSATNPSNPKGAIQGYILNSIVIGNKIILSGVFTASVSGNFIARNMVSMDISSGQLQATPVSLAAGSSIYDMKMNNNKIYIAGTFSLVNGISRNNLAVLDNNLNLLNEVIDFTGAPFLTTKWVDKIAFYDKYLIAKGKYAAVNGNNFALYSDLVVKVIDLNTNTLMPWNIPLPGSPISNSNTFQMIRNKLYIRNREVFGSPFFIYCFEPIKLANNILFPGSTLPNPSPSVSICSPDSGNNKVFIAPFRYADLYMWNYSGINATVVPQGNGSTAKLIVNNSSTNGVLSVTGYNDCGLSTSTATLNVTINPKPTFTTPVSPQLIICNPDSLQLQSVSNNTNSNIYWRKSNSVNYNSQPYYVKEPGNYFSIITDNINGCADSNLIKVNNFKINPNAKILSHNYPGVAIPIDTITCYQPSVNINAGSDTADVTITWKKISNNVIYSNPLNISNQNNLKVIVTRNDNNCADSSLIVLIGQNNALPYINVDNKSKTINCSYSSASLQALFSPTSCTLGWTGPFNYSSANPGITSSPGKYFITAFNSDNGCTNIDSVTINYSNTFSFKSHNDTTLCKGSGVELYSTAISTLSGITYTWNNGSHSNTISVNPLVTSQYIISANEPGGCYGSDTIQIHIPKDIQDSIISFRSCDDELKGNILIYAKGGIPPYKYSLTNGITFSDINNFSGLSFGNYPVMIKDSIGCTKTNTVSLNAQSNLPIPKFLASTHNFKSDTIVLVDISIPKPDSVKWILPLNANQIGGNMYSPVIVLNDTGSFIITMKGYFGHCEINTSKTIQFSEADSLFANHYNANGIKTFSLYPNPNSGQFTVRVEFYKKQNFSIQVWDNTPYRYFSQSFYDSAFIELPIDISTVNNGHYILRVIGEFDSRNSSFIINK